jgi:adenosine/AMP kinase
MMTTMCVTEPPTRDKEKPMELRSIPIEFPEGSNIILGQSHFIKTVEDLYEIMVTSSPVVKFGIAFAEASGPCLIRHDGNSDKLENAAVAIMEAVGAGHTFVIVMEEAFPISVLSAVKACQEVCSVYCATGNPVEVVAAENGSGRGILGVIDGSAPLGVEGTRDAGKRRAFLRTIGHKR